ncbi:Cof-type HAD-IIB family hydrolase [Erysipelatoclostridium sp. AM42-17]|uniref:Cof-type HAD-IIB family hydrolase n=1 Tax=Erysipelatoclostridium sp. AM42-17 TaxID=2293102 RepID=UPI000E4A3671|nr:Cof-type HAD-IIB family hydrolase [Erysipelatoclostridium sp. AM42-17]RHS92520.1 Cof-type HAD-IIB family hydrolase [Erysipelatoclostridium sp. AM42-17]
MKKNIIFFDVDGTLVDVRPSQEYVPASTIKAIQETRKKGNLCFLCTGRSLPEIFDHILDIGFDGIIGAGGGFVLIGDKMLYHNKVSDADVKRVVDFFEENHYDYYLESNGGLFASKHLIPRLEYITYGDLENDENAKKMKKEKPSHFINSLKEGYSMYRSDVNKICFLENPNIPFSTIKENFDDAFQVIHCTVPSFGEDSGELSVAGVNKASAIQAVINHLKIDINNTYAFGDGLNDIDMLQFVHHGVAVGNAKQGLKDIADEICEDIADNGIYNTMKKHSLI